MLTSIDRNGITQRVVHRWEEDVIGQVVTPKPIHDWKAWREAKLAAKAKAVLPDGLSRLQRERLEKKLKKGKLKVV